MPSYMECSESSMVGRRRPALDDMVYIDSKAVLVTELLSSQFVYLDIQTGKEGFCFYAARWKKNRPN
jgi:hypothetical protein